MGGIISRGGRRISRVPQWMAEAVGADRVWTRGITVVVESAADMQEWELRQYRRTAIVVGGERYAVVEKRLLDGGGYRYVLEPWPEGVDVPGRTVVYDADYANARDAAARLATRRDRVGKALFFVGPLLGLLPARVKLALDDRYGFDPRTVTRQCLFLQRFFFYSLLALIVVGGWARALGGWDGWLRTRRGGVRGSRHAPRAVRERRGGAAGVPGVDRPRLATPARSRDSAVPERRARFQTPDRSESRRRRTEARAALPMRGS